jgi:serine protease Do
MKKFGIIVLAACLGGLVALQANRWITRLTAPSAGDLRQSIAQSAADIRPVDTETTQSLPDLRSAVKKVLPSVVSIDAVRRDTDWFGQVVEAQGSGSGVVISNDGYILTNNHVVRNGANGPVADAVRVHLEDGRNFPAKVVGTDPRADLAVLKIEAKGLIPARLGKSSDLQVGEWVIAAGNPLGFENTVSAGIVSSLNRELPVDETALVGAIQTDAAINPGNSGGALANSRGEVVGINTAIAGSNRSIGLGFAIPIDRAQIIAADLVKYGRARYGQMGVVIHRGEGLLQNPYVRQQLSEFHGAEPPQYGLVLRAEPIGAAKAAGMKEFAILLEINGRKLNAMSDFSAAMADKRPGQSVNVKFWQKGKTSSVEITLQE